jgi:tyrosinase
VFYPQNRHVFCKSWIRQRLNKRSKYYLTAANEFRIPYWDWAQGTTAGPVPDIFTAPYLTIIDTDRTPVVISNPLYSYTFDPVPEGFDMKVS